MVWRFLKKLEIKPPYDPAIPLLGIYPEETKIERDTCIPLFIAVLFTVARTWKQPRCPSTDEWIKMLCTYAQWNIRFSSVSSVAQSCPTLCDPMNPSTPGLPVHHQLPEFTETHVHRLRENSSLMFRNVHSFGNHCGVGELIAVIGLNIPVMIQRSEERRVGKEC